jgi:advillin
MTNQELFKQAIADAKSVRDAAVANAKAALEETFTPRIMNMLSAKLNEMEDDDMKDEAKKVEEEGYDKTEEGHEATIGFGAASQKPQIEADVEEGDNMEEADLEEILAQLEAEEKEGEKVDEAKDEVEEGKKEDMEEAKKKEVEEAKKDNNKKKVEESLDEADADDEVTELTVDELKDIIRDVLKDVMGGEGEEADEESDEVPMGDDEVEVDDEESISLDELLAELDKEDDEKKEEGKKDMEEAKKKDMEEAKKDKKDLEEAIKTIRFLQSELNEVNLLNAKLLYTNKIFKTKTLSEVQKVKVVKSLDKATNVKEARTIYDTLVESLTTKAKSNIRESVGFASKAVGIAPKQPIVESDSAVRRMQQLAGIIK